MADPVGKVLSTSVKNNSRGRLLPVLPVPQRFPARGRIRVWVLDRVAQVDLRRSVGNREN